jgi:mono/diheme cytochrome c family protein
MLNIGGLAVVVAVAFMSSAHAQSGPKTIWDGVYTSEQANRGQDLYDKKCSECHQDDLSGGGDEAAAVLRGADFFARWKDRPVAELFQKIAESMPKNAPGSLSPKDTADVVAFLFKKNQVPASDVDLSTDVGKLGQVVMTDKPR